ncbi:MAG: type II CRISPR-associated endonuclease Cas1 [Rikenellaceae bacterium]
MIKRTLLFVNPQRISLKNCQLVCESMDDEAVKKSVPIEDIGIVILENPMTKITLPALNALVESNVAVVLCNNLRMPSAMLQPLDGNSVQGEIFRQQVAASEPLKKGLWRQTVEAKIKNQAALLDKLGLDGARVLQYSKAVKSGDSDNREGAAARAYWHELFGGDFIREQYGEAPNALLNYGYTILRAATARSLVGSGLLPAFGIFHHNRYNAFPLADDIMEPYRPYVDEVVYRLYRSGVREVDKGTKIDLLGVLRSECKFKELIRPLELALTITTASLAKCYAGKQKLVSYPMLR